MGHPTSPVWLLSKAELTALIAQCDTISAVLQHFGLRNAGGNYGTLQRRCRYDNIDLTELRKRSKQLQGGDPAAKQPNLEDVLVENSTYKRGSLKRRLIATGLLVTRCAICGLTDTWQGHPLVLVLDHINGVWNDNRLENLRLLCPNCNSQTETFAGRNPKRNKCRIAQLAER